MPQLRFNSHDVRKLIIHAWCHPANPITVRRTTLHRDHPRPWTKPPGKTTRLRTGLWFVKHEGIYLISPVCSDDHAPGTTRSTVVYAHGFHPEQDQNVNARSHLMLGPDDFGQHIELSQFATLMHTHTHELLLDVTPTRIVFIAPRAQKLTPIRHSNVVHRHTQ